MRAVDPAQRFANSYVIDEDGCWLWQKSLNQDGYGRFKVHGRMVGAHRFSYENLVGVIPTGFEVNHTCHSDVAVDCVEEACKHRSCVNPQHLEVLSKSEHRGKSRNAQRTHCKNGHELLGRYKDGRRFCVECVAERSRNWVKK